MALANLELGIGLSLATLMLFRLSGQSSILGARRDAPPWLVGVLAATVVLVVLRPATALMVGAVPNSPQDTSMNPATPGSGWTQGDPGWANAAWTAQNLNAVYIGDGWMLSAWHAGVDATTFVESGQTFDPIPNQFFRVPNLSFPGGPTAAYADLQLYRINGDPGLPSLTIASSPLALNDEVMFIANGLFRNATELHWTVTVNPGPDNDTWTPVGSCSGSNCYHGYGSAGYGKRWGTNLIANDNILGASENDENITVNVGNSTIAYLTQYNRQSSPCNVAGRNCFETQVISGDSGSGVFHKRGGVWELAGITTNMYSYDGQNTTIAVYNDNGNGDASAFADLSSYYSQIAAIKAAHVDYSIVGDLNLDGSVNDADISIFVANWGHVELDEFGMPKASITSWKLGDLTHDGKTDINDFFKWRNEASGSAAAIGSLLGLPGDTGAVPEPAAVFLCLGPATLYALAHRRRRQQATS